ncbi:hypothetical protein [uncultured Shewanella sp.]|uniref:hypothetical protein n=1 Tax=uncultured Shewanella sp. TaxID=173975 RepID=UPI002636CC86|nr:hypothetical protein [uncultured Shewanella sp.]
MLNKINILLIFSVIFALITFYGYAEKRALMVAAEQKKTWLVVLSADQGVLIPSNLMNHYTLVLHDIDPDLVLFTDRPNRDTRLAKTEQFIEAFEAIFSLSAPNAALIHTAEHSQLEKSPQLEKSLQRDKSHQHDKSPQPELRSTVPYSNRPAIVILKQAKWLNDNSLQFSLVAQQGAHPLRLGKLDEVRLFIDAVDDIGIKEGIGELISPRKGNR